MNKIVLCEPYHPFLHGETHKDLYGHYLAMWWFSATEYYAGEHLEIHNVWLRQMQPDLLRIHFHETRHPHPLVKNYWNLLHHVKHGCIEIAQVVLLETGEYVAILKTFWLRIFQRKWRNILKERKRVIKERTRISSLLYRQYHGKFPPSCAYMP